MPIELRRAWRLEQVAEASERVELNLASSGLGYPDEFTGLAKTQLLDESMRDH